MEFSSHLPANDKRYTVYSHLVVLCVCVVSTLKIDAGCSIFVF